MYNNIPNINNINCMFQVRTSLSQSKHAVSCTALVRYCQQHWNVSLCLLLLINTICVCVCVWWKYTLTDKLNSAHSMWFVFSSSSVQRTFLSIIYNCMEWDVTVWYVEYTENVLSVVSPLVDVWDVHSTRVASHQTNQDKLVIYTQCIMLWTVEFYCFNTFLIQIYYTHLYY